MKGFCIWLLELTELDMGYEKNRLNLKMRYTSINWINKVITISFTLLL